MKMVATREGGDLGLESRLRPLSACKGNEAVVRYLPKYQLSVQTSSA